MKQFYKYTASFSLCVLFVFLLTTVSFAQGCLQLKNTSWVGTLTNKSKKINVTLQINTVRQVRYDYFINGTFLYTSPGRKADPKPFEGVCTPISPQQLATVSFDFLDDSFDPPFSSFAGTYDSSKKEISDCYLSLYKKSAYSGKLTQK